MSRVPEYSLEIMHAYCPGQELASLQERYVYHLAIVMKNILSCIVSFFPSPNMGCGEYLLFQGPLALYPVSCI